MLIDAVFAILVCWAFLKGYRQGFVMAVFSFVAFVIGIAAALKLSAVVASRLHEHTSLSGKWLPMVSFMLVFIIVVVLVQMGGRLVQQTIEMAMLGWINRIAGFVVFLLLYSIIYSIFLFYAVQMQLITAETTSTSASYPYLSLLAPRVMNGIGEVIPLFKDLFLQLEAFFEGVSNKLGH